MKAAQITTYGHAEAVQITEIAKPAVGPGQVLVEVHAASLNPFDTSVREGHVAQMVPALPATLGGDLAGVVVQVGESVSHVSVGDNVYGQAAVVAGNSGAFAQYAVTSAAQVAKMPGKDFQIAAALPLVGVSALQALTQHIKLAAGQKLFIQGGSGGIGSIAVQLAKHLGAHVATTATGPGQDYARQLGADEVIDYKNQDFTSLLSDYDAVFDTAGGEGFNRSLSILKPGGIAVSMIAQADATLAKQQDVTAITQGTHVTTEALNELRQLVETGVIKVAIGQVFPLDQVRSAFETREGGQALGKIVLAIA